MLSRSHKTIDRATPPPGKTPGPAVFPPFSQHSLGNGIPLYLVENHIQPFVSLQLVIGSGARDDGELPGLASTVCTLLLSGAGERDAEGLAESIDFLGAELDAGSGRDEITVRLGVLREHLPEALDLLADVVLRPTFPAAEVARERRQSIATLEQNESDPNYLAAVQLRRELYSGTPYGSEIEGTRESLRKIGRRECVRFHREHFVGGDAFFVVAGDATASELIEMLGSRFGGWGGTRPPSVDFPESRLAPERRVTVIDRPDALQSSFRVGRGAIARRDPDFIPLIVLNTLFGGYFNSRLNQNLREEHGYTYGARSIVETLRMPGLFSCGASVATEVTSDAVAETLKELARIASEPVGEEELQMVKRYIIGSQALQTETPGQVASFVRSIALYGLPHDYYVHFPSMVEELTSDRLLDVARRLLDPATMTIIAVGNAAGIAGGLERFGPVHHVGVVPNNSLGRDE